MKLIIQFSIEVPRGGSRTAATIKIERFVIIVNGFQLDFAAALDPPLVPLTFQMPYKHPGKCHLLLNSKITQLVSISGTKS